MDETLPPTLLLRGYRYMVDSMTGEGRWVSRDRQKGESELVVDMTVTLPEQYVMEVPA